ncbi:hypothetical protein EIP86_006811 [Pleurotus ostreatoroseus]|nr:hypothetical protein EIP86_006811 [Pleurotus ostreatoroseus]
MSASSSPASTSTTAPSSSSTPPTKSGGFFSSGGSPALILAFLAIGIFAGGLISMLFLRRLALRHFFHRTWTREADAENWEIDWTAMLTSTAQRRKSRKKLGAKPKLYEPLSSAYAEKEPPAQLPEEVPLLPTEPPPAPSRLTSLLPWPKPPARLPTPPPSPPPSYDSLTGTLQVGVAILMPLQEERSSRRPEGEPRVPLFELGFVEFPWTEEQHALCQSQPIAPDTQSQEAGPSTETA